MDIMRYLLSIAVIIAHINYLTDSSIPFPISSFEGVGGFFALSGFLMYPNYVRHNNLIKYTRQRARRILPPYFFIVIAAALCLSVVSYLNPYEYYTSDGFFAYLGANLSFLNWLHPELPGVFQGTDYVTQSVNGSLWTMKVEWCLYFSVPCFIWLINHIKHIRKHWFALGVIIVSIIYRLIFTNLYYATGNEIYNILRRQIFGQLSFFYAGMLIYFMKDYFIRHLWVFFLIGISLRVLMNISGICSIILEPFAISSIVLSLSLFPYSIKKLIHRNNISYEMYLFHFPIIQLGIFLGIKSSGVWTTITYVFASTIIISFCVHMVINRWILKRVR